MSEDEWLLSVVTKAHGAKAVLDRLDAKFIDEAKKTPSLSNMDTMLLAHVLSFTHIEDTLSVMRVNQQWHAATRMHHFWAKRIERKKRLILEIRFIKSPALAVMAFDTFSSPVTETLRDQVEWVFRSWVKIFDTDSGQTIVRRMTGRGTCIGQWFDKSTLIRRTWMEATNGFVSSGRSVSECMDRSKSNGVRTRIELAFPKATLALVAGRTRHGFYEGESIMMDGLYQPHGKGKWTFDDGEILEGPGVAFHGEPRMPYKKLKT